MKILLPNGQEVQLPENFSSIAFMSDDLFYEVAFFRKDVLPYVQYFCYTTDGGMKNQRYLNLRQDCCHDIVDAINPNEDRYPEEGLYQICFTFDYDEDAYIKGEYEIRYTPDD